MPAGVLFRNVYPQVFSHQHSDCSIHLTPPAPKSSSSSSYLFDTLYIDIQTYVSNLKEPQFTQQALVN